MKNNPDLLQESEVENADAYLPADQDKINEDDENMNILMEEEQQIVKKIESGCQKYLQKKNNSKTNI